MNPSLVPLPSSLRVLFVLVVGSLAFGGCGGGGTYTIDEGQVAQRFLPPERTVHHPDTLRALTLSEKDGKVHFQLERDYQSLVEKWSSSYQDVGAGRSTKSRTFATFRSLELALVSLQPQMGIQSLRREQAQALLDKRRQQYLDEIRIDVYWFTGRNQDGIITGPGARTELRIDEDRTLRPIREDHGPLREAYVTGGNVALYRQNTLVFPRTVKGTDVLANSSQVRLTVRRTGTQSREEFSWEWREDDE